VSWADVPSVARLADGSLVAQWLKDVDPTIEAYDLLLSVSHDNGRTWSTPFKPHHDKTRTQHGFASMFAWPDAAQPGFGVVWLDGRDQELNTKDPEGGSMALYYARYDRAGKQVAEAVVDARVCECCSTSVAVTSEGPLPRSATAATRKCGHPRVVVREGHVRGRKTWSAPVAATRTTGRSTRARSTAGDRGVTGPSPWRGSHRRRRRHAYAAFSRRRQVRRADPPRTTLGRPRGHRDAAWRRRAAATWVEFTVSARLRLRRGRAVGPRSAAGGHRRAGARSCGRPPCDARAGNELVLAWTESQAEGDEGQGQQVHVATATLP
jgi:hypothetical protein